jgi:hypothetical protein
MPQLNLRIPFFGMAASTPSRLPMLGQPTMMLFSDYCTRRSRITQTMFAGLQSLPLPSYSSRILVRSPGLCSSSDPNPLPPSQGFFSFLTTRPTVVVSPNTRLRYEQKQQHPTSRQWTATITLKLTRARLKNNSNSMKPTHSFFWFKFRGVKQGATAVYTR